MSAKEKIAWLKGLLSGLEIDGKDAKIYGAVAEALDALATRLEEQDEQIESLRNLYDELEEECSALGDDVSALEDLFDEYVKTEDDDEEDDDYVTKYVAVKCPACSAVFYYDADNCENDGEEDVLECPECMEKFPLSFGLMNGDEDGRQN